MKKISSLLVSVLILVGIICFQGCVKENFEIVFSVEPSNAAEGVAINPAIQVRVQSTDGKLMPVNGGIITLSIGNNPSSGTLSGTLSKETVEGVATFDDLSIDLTGTGYTLAASAQDVLSVTSAAFNITPSGASQLEFLVQPSENTSFQKLNPSIQVRVLDSAGNLVEDANNSITLSFGTNPGNTIIRASGRGQVPELAALGMKAPAQFENLKAYFVIDPAIPSQLYWLENKHQAEGTPVLALAYDSANQIFYGSDDSYNFFSVNPLTGEETIIGDELSNYFKGLTFESGGSHRLLAVACPDCGSENLYSVELSDSSSTDLGSFSYDLDEVYGFAGLATDPTDGTIYAVAYISLPPEPTKALSSLQAAFDFHLVTINPDPGVMTLTDVGPLCDAQEACEYAAGIAFASNGTLYAITGDGSTTPHNLYTVDKTTGMITHLLDINDEYTNSGETIQIIPARLMGTVTVDAVNGIATFDNVKINAVADGYTLIASSGDLTSATSNIFNITAPELVGTVGFTVNGEGSNYQTVSEADGQATVELSLYSEGAITHDVIITTAATDVVPNLFTAKALLFDAAYRHDISFERYYNFTIPQGETSATLTINLTNDELSQCYSDYVMFCIVESSMAPDIGEVSTCHTVEITDDDCVEP
jgi:hypothetical protein